MTQTSAPSSSRFMFLDVARGIAVLWMIQVHITNVYLDPAIHTTTTFDFLNVTNGYVAPTFIFLAGAGFWIAVSRKLTTYLQFGEELRTYLRRLSYILWCAFTLHVPFFSLERTLIATPSELLPGLQIDVLHTIVYSTLIGLCFVVLGRSVQRVTLLSGIAALIVLSTSWWMWTHMPSSSPFPMFPWSFYFFAGAYLTAFFLRSTHKELVAKSWIVISILLPVVLFTLKLSSIPAPWSIDIWWKSTPSILLFCCSATLCLLGILYLNEQRLQRSRIGSFLQIVGQESLFMYVTHIILVYGKGASAFRDYAHIPPQGYLGVAVIWLCITLPLFALMLMWHKLKKDRPALAQRILAFQVLIMIISYLVLPADFPFF